MWFWVHLDLIRTIKIKKLKILLFIVWKKIIIFEVLIIPLNYLVSQRKIMLNNIKE